MPNEIPSMDKNLPDIENLFRSNLYDNEDMPSSKVWSGVEQTLDKDSVVSIKNKYGNLKRVTIVLLLLLIGLSIYDLRINYVKRKSAEGNKLVSREAAKRKSIKINADKIRPLITNSVMLANKNKSSNLNDSSLSSIKPNLIAKALQLERRSKEYTVMNHLKQKAQYIFGLKNKPFKLQNNKTIDLKNISDGIIFGEQVNKPGQNHNQLVAKLMRDDMHNSGIRPDKKYSSIYKERLVKSQITYTPLKINSLVNIAGKLNVLLIDTLKLHPLVNVKSTAGINNNLGGNKKDQKQGTGRESKLSATLFFSPDFAWYRLQNDLTDNQSVRADDIEKGEQHEFSSTAGALIDYILSKHWAIQSGLTYSNTAITVEPRTIYAQADNAGTIKYRFNTSSGYSYLLPSFSTSPGIGDSLYAFTSSHTLQYMGIPLAIKYSLWMGKVNLNVMLGVSANFLTKGKIETVLEKGTTNESEIINNIQGLKSAYASGLFGVGAEYKLKKSISVTFTPTVRFALSAINKGAVVKSYPNSFGFATGIRIKLK